MGDLTVTDSQARGTAVLKRDGSPRYEPFGRPTIYSEDVRDAICEHIRNGTTIRYAALAAGIGHETFYAWMAEREDFSDAVARAQAEWMATMSASLTRGVTGDPAYKGDGKLALMALERRDKAGWGPSLEVKRLDDDTILRFLRASSEQQQAITEDGIPALLPGDDAL